MDHVSLHVERHEIDVILDDHEGNRLAWILFAIRMRTRLPDIAATEMDDDLIE